MSDETRAYSHELSPGTTLQWYEIRSVLGHGGFGITYAGHDDNLDKPVAIKEYFPRGFALREADGRVRPLHSAGDQDTFGWGLQRFKDEARTLARFEHRNVVRVYSVFEANGSAYMVMALERGANFRQVIEEKRIKDEATLLPIIHALLDGLETIHADGLIHRDIKPANILLREEDGSPVFIDFGSARYAMGNETQYLTSIVSRGYAPFEQYAIEGSESRQGPWTDIYSLGATLYCVVTGKQPADALTRSNALLEGAPDPVLPALDQGRFAARYSAETLAAIETSLAFHAEMRPQSVKAWRGQFPPLPAGAVEVRTTNNPGGRQAHGAVAGRKPPPPARTAKEENGAHSGMGHRDLSGLKVMVIDDQTFVHKLMQTMLGKLGITAITFAENGVQALDVLSENERIPDIVFCDLSMPKMDGVTLLRHLGERRLVAGIVLLSGEDPRILRTAESLARSYGLYVLGSLEKPVKPADLESVLRTFDPHRTDVPLRVLEPIGEDELREGLKNGALTPVFQPKVSTRDRRVLGVEALSRWNHPTRGMLGAGAFIPLAEERGHMDALTRAVLQMSLKETAAWHAEGLDLSLSVNVSVESLHRTSFPEEVIRMAQGEGLDPGKLVLEVTESRLVMDGTNALSALARFRLAGTGLSIDDYGTGYSSLAQLKRIPFTELKIDRAFVHGAADDPTARAILESSVALAKKLGLKTVAEGAETQEDWDMVSELGCDMVQGYFCARPMPGDEIPAWAGRWESGHA